MVAESNLETAAALEHANFRTRHDLLIPVDSADAKPSKEGIGWAHYDQVMQGGRRELVSGSSFDTPGSLFSTRA
jgi:hypothetical protein